MSNAEGTVQISTWKYLCTNQILAIQIYCVKRKMYCLSYEHWQQIYALVSHRRLFLPCFLLPTKGKKNKKTKQNHPAPKYLSLMWSPKTQIQTDAWIFKHLFAYTPLDVCDILWINFRSDKSLKSSSNTLQDLFPFFWFKSSSHEESMKKRQIFREFLVINSQFLLI